MDITKLSQNYMLRAFDVDTKGQWQPSAILTRMQEIAEDHASVVHFGRKELVVERDMAWMLTRVHLEMKRYPKLNDNIKVITWPGKPSNVFFGRYTILLDEDGEELGRATSLWVLFNIKDRFLCRTGDIGDNYPYDLSHGTTLPDPTKIKLPKKMELLQTRTVGYSEVDMNGHLNNAKYANWICELFDDEILKRDSIKELKINYIAEAYMGQHVDLYMQETDGVYYVCGKTGDKRVFDASVTWNNQWR
ncbi:MAG: thioesterase [Christensenella sp.]